MKTISSPQISPISHLYTGSDNNGGRSMDDEMASSHWIGADDLDEDDPMRVRAEAFDQQVNWDALKQICCKVREASGCVMRKKYSMGHFNLVRHVIFDDGKEWIARLRLPDIPSELGERKPLDVKSEMESEIAATKFLRLKSEIPVPDIHFYDLDPGNKVGAPFMLMDYINGNTAAELCRKKKHAWGDWGTEEQDAKFRQQMARIQTDLARFRFDSIGSLRFNQTDNTFFVGPDVDTGLGPWKSSFAYYADVAEEAMKSARSRDELSSRDSFFVPMICKEMITRLCSDDTGPFSLTNLDFGVHNIIVDDDFSIIGVIDLGSIMAAPKEVVGQFPAYAAMKPGTLGVPHRTKYVTARLEKEEPKMKAYTALLKEYADVPDRQTFADIMTIPHELIRRLTGFSQYQDWVNDEYMTSLRYMLLKHGFQK